MYIILGAIMLSLAALSACSQNSENKGAAAQTTAAEPTAEATTAATTAAEATTAEPAAAGAAQGKFVLTEADGTVVSLDKKPERLVVLSDNTVGILYELGVKPAGISTPTQTIPDGWTDLPQTGSARTPDFEKIIALQPDLVISNFAFKSIQKQSFEQNNIKVYFISNQQYEETLKSIQMLGDVFGNKTKADALIKGIRDREAEIRESVAGKEPPRVMIIFGTSQSFMFARENSYVGNLVEMLKGKNITSDMNIAPGMGSNIPFSIEEAVIQNPQVILRVAHGGNPEEVKKAYEKEFETNPLWKSIDAVKNGRVYDLDQHLFFANPGLESIDALEKLSQILYP